MPDDRFDPASPGALGRLLRAQGLLSSGSIADAVSSAGPIVPQNTPMPRYVPMGVPVAPPQVAAVAPAQQQQQPPVTVNVIGNGGPAPTPPVSSELAGSPAFRETGPLPSPPVAPPGLVPDSASPADLHFQALRQVQLGSPAMGPTVTPPASAGLPVPPVAGATPAGPITPQTAPLPVPPVSSELAGSPGYQALRDVQGAGVPLGTPAASAPTGPETPTSPAALRFEALRQAQGAAMRPQGPPMVTLKSGASWTREDWEALAPQERTRYEAETPEDREARIEGTPTDRTVPGSTAGEGPETAGRPASEISAARDAAATGGRPGETIQVPGLRPDPMAIDALTRRYTDDVMGPLSDTQRYDDEGRPIPLSEDDLMYRRQVLQDQGFRDKVGALARERAVAEEQARQALPLREDAAATATDVASQRADLLRRYVELHRQHWDEARRAQAEADAQYPNPDDLLGGQGSWARAMALGIASVNSPVAFQGLTSMLNAQMALEYAGQQARYGRARMRAADARENADEAFRTMSIEDQAQQARLGAAKDRVAAGLEAIAARTADQVAQAHYMDAAGKLREDSAKMAGESAQQMATIDLKNVQMANAGWRYDAKRGIWVHLGMPTPQTGVGAGGAVVNTPENPFGKLGVREPDRQGRPGGWWKASNEDSQKKATEAGIEYVKLDDALNQMQVLADQAQGARSAGGQVWAKWQSEHDAEYNLAFLNATQIAGRVLHGRPPGKFTMQEVKDEYPQLAKMWEANNAQGVIRWLRDDADRTYNKSMHQYGYNGTYRSDRPVPTQEPDTTNLPRQIVGDYVPGHAPSVEAAVGQNRGGALEDRGALGAYVKAYYELRNGTDSDLQSRLLEMRQRALGNQLKAVQRKDTQAASNWRIIGDAVLQQAREVASGAARKALAAAASKRAGEAARRAVDTTDQGPMP